MAVKKPSGLRRVVVTGLGMVSSMGLDVPTVWSRLLQGESGIRRLSTVYDEAAIKYKAPEDYPLIGGEVQGFDLREILQVRKEIVTKEDLKQLKYTDLLETSDFLDTVMS